MDTSVNTRLRLAHDFVHFTDRHVFLTGKAGTGKTTFLRSLKQSSTKRLAIVAPTGVAAINAGGVTIHSFFQLPFGPILPEGMRQDLDAAFRKFQREKIRLIRSLDLLVIDEVSMVRADVLDGIDRVLRRFRHPALPFGGLQVLMIGDLHQLPPIAKQAEWDLLKEHYETPYFFSSHAVQQSNPIAIELTHIYRQSDAAFKDLLNRIREHQVDEALLQELNQRYIPGFIPEEEEGYITLTTHNTTAYSINRQKLEALPGTEVTFEAVIKDDFPPQSFPTETSLKLKVGAQVMFVKNDSSREKLYYNGKIGRISRIEGDAVSIQCGGEAEEIIVRPVTWENIRYALDPSTKEVKEERIGAFTQYPLRLAWAITIHKSQGLTFEKAIIEASAAFAHGQVYVALSRCKTLEGLVLRSRIGPNSIRTDDTVARFSRELQERSPDEARLQVAKKQFQQTLILELFDFIDLKNRLGYCLKIAADHTNTLPRECLPALQWASDFATSQLFSKADLFRSHLDRYLAEDTLPEEHAELQQRIMKAGHWYEEQLSILNRHLLEKVIPETDNKAVRAALTEALEGLEKECALKTALFRECKNGFLTISYLREKGAADLDFKTARKSTDAGPAFGSPTHDVLRRELKAWRDGLAAEKGIPVYMVLPQRTLTAILELLPTTWHELATIKGMGRAKMHQYGAELLRVIQDYISAYGIQTGQRHIVLPEE